MPDQSKTRKVGPFNQCPCPWCGKLNDCSGLMEQQLVEKGSVIDCDHCKRLFQVVQIDTRPRFIVQQFHGKIDKKTKKIEG